MTAALGLAWVALFLVGAARWAPPRRLVAPVASPATPGPGSPLTALGTLLRRMAGRSVDPRAARRWGTTAVAVAVGLPVGWPVAVAVGAAAWWVPGLVAQRRRGPRVEALPDVVDLLTVAVAGGLTVRLALERLAPTSAARALGIGIVLDHVRAGARLADALEAWGATAGPALTPLVTALAGTERTGAPLLPALERLSDEARTQRRRHAEERARTLPVKLLFPLVVCILPAFGLLTVVPLIAGALRGLSL